MDIKLDSGVPNSSTRLRLTDGKLELTSGRADSLAQRLQIRFKTYQGSWFLNENYGINWFRDVLGKGKTKLSVDVLIQNEILKDNLIDRITYFKSQISSSYVYSCLFKVQMVDGTTTEVIKLLTTESGLVLTTDSGLALIV